MKQLYVTLFLMLALATTAAVMAQATAADQPTAGEAAQQAIDADPSAHVESIFEALQDKNWSYAIGAVLMFLVWAIRKFFWTSIPSKYVPWIAAVLGVIADVGLSLITNVVWWKAILSGFTSGAAAIALWELGFKRLLGTPEPAPAEKPA